MVEKKSWSLTENDGKPWKFKLSDTKFQGTKVLKWYEI
jgi:hypothetical protein